MASKDFALAVKGLKEAMDREKTEREKMCSDLKFVCLDQWPESVRSQRQNDPNGARPCLTIDKIGQYRMQIINGIRKNPPAVKIRAVDDQADPETAKIFQGITRHIEDISRAKIAYETAAEWAIDVGVGYFRFTTDYVSPESFDQEIYIKPIFDPLSVYLGKHFMPDGSDATEGWVIEDVSEDKFKQEWPNKKVASAGILELDSPFNVDEKTVRVAERFYFEDEARTLLRLADGQAIYKDDYAKLESVPELMVDGDGNVVEKTSVKRKVCWQKMTGAEILEEGVWAGKFIPIVKVTGHQKIVNGEKLTWGIVRPAIDSARMYNYWASTITEKLALAPKVPFVGAVGQFATSGAKWEKANRENLAYLEYDPIEVAGNAVPPPRRVDPAAMEGAMMQQLQVIEHDIQTSLGMFKASVGEEQGDQSGRAIRALQGQSDTATFHFPSNVTLSVEHGGRIMVDLIPKIYDTPRIVRILGEDGKPQMVQLNPEQPQAAKQFSDSTGAIRTIYNLGVGQYDVTVTVGPSYATSRMETVEVLGEAMKGNPNLVPILGDLMFRAMDAKVADQAADRLEKMLPPQLRDQQEQTSPQARMMQMSQQMQQMQQGIQELQAENQKLKSGEAQAQAKIAASVQESSAKIAAEEEQAKAEWALKARAQEAELALARERADAELALERQKAIAKASFDKWKAELDAKTKLDITRIEAVVDIKTSKNEQTDTRPDGAVTS